MKQYFYTKDEGKKGFSLQYKCNWNLKFKKSLEDKANLPKSLIEKHKLVDGCKEERKKRKKKRENDEIIRVLIQVAQY